MLRLPCIDDPRRKVIAGAADIHRVRVKDEPVLPILGRHPTDREGRDARVGGLDVEVRDCSISSIGTQIWAGLTGGNLRMGNVESSNAGRTFQTANLPDGQLV